ncbi:TonB-dependent siderophore receptor [Caulobacter mirabilis]|uniref:TonB-dependent siderophore receptor n=1 Tax=Caulobacter mirabilis TaxID=69666 RepID=A0A2D2B3J7_9CAUL|nr:TonB-dependent siderophore receptor [Caulobacter mirabilis]
MASFVALAASPVAAEQTSAVDVGEIVVTAQRTSSQVSAPTHQVTTLKREEIEAGRAVSDTLSTLLAKAVPGLADSSRTMTDYGQTLRGRGALILVDGVPYNTNRDSSRNLISVDPSDIERIEVLRGGSAIYGGGATGGIISINTRPAGGPLRIETTLSGVAALSNLTGDGVGGRVQQFISGRAGDVDFALNGGYQRIAAGYDAHGDRRAPEPSQGDLIDSDAWSFGGKLGRRIGETGYLRGSLGYYRADQDTDYAADPAVGRLPPGAANARPLKGLELAEQNQVRNTIVTAGYTDRDILGSRVDVLAYYRDLFVRFTPFDARAIANRGRNVDQVYQNTKTVGARLTVDTPLGSNTSLSWGGDLGREVSDMPLDVFDPAAYDASGGLVFRRTGTLIFMPELTTDTQGAFVQLQHRFSDLVSVQGGVRYDRAEASFDTFTPLSQYRAPSPVQIQGGTISFDGWTYNLGAALTPVEGHEVYAAFSQGFQLPDIGLQLRGANAGFNLANSYLQPVKIDSYEAGWRGRIGPVAGTLAIFRTSSDLGDVQTFNNGLILLRTAERVDGVEASFDVGQGGDAWRYGGGATYLRGRERLQTATSWRNMTGYRIPPLKLTAYVQYAPTDRWDVRLQGLYSGERDYRLDGVASFGRREVKSYAVVDLIARYRPNDRDTVTVGVENLLNTQYLPVYSQLLRSSTNTSRVPANGATLTVTFKRSW